MRLIYFADLRPDPESNRRTKTDRTWDLEDRELPATRGVVWRELKDDRGTGRGDGGGIGPGESRGIPDYPGYPDFLSTPYRTRIRTRME